MKVLRLAASNRLLSVRATFVPLSCLCVLLAGCFNVNWGGDHTVRGSGNVVTETRAVSQFDRVAVAGSGRLSVIQDNQESLTIEADDNLLPLIKSDVANGLLRIGRDRVNLGPSKTIHYTLHLKSLKELHLSGSLEVEAPSVTSDHLLLAISGSGNIRVAKLEAGDLGVQVSGSGDIEVAGKVKSQDIRISGSGNYRAGGCESQSVVIQVSGSGDATVWAHATLEARVSGSGDIKYHGSPQVNAAVSGSGGIHPLGNR